MHLLEIDLFGHHLQVGFPTRLIPTFILLIGIFVRDDPLTGQSLVLHASPKVDKAALLKESLKLGLALLEAYPLPLFIPALQLFRRQAEPRHRKVVDDFGVDVFERRIEGRSVGEEQFVKGVEPFVCQGLEVGDEHVVLVGER